MKVFFGIFTPLLDPMTEVKDDSPILFPITVSFGENKGKKIPECIEQDSVHSFITDCNLKIFSPETISMNGLFSSW